MNLNREKYRQLVVGNEGVYTNSPVAAIQDANVPGDYWKAVAVHKLTPEENQRSHNVYFDLLDENGNFVEKPTQQIGFTWDGRNEATEPANPVKLDKSGNEPKGNLPIFGGQHAKVWVIDAIPSDAVAGLTIDLPGEGDDSGNSQGHHSWYVIWQKTTEGTVTAPVVPDPQPQPNYSEAHQALDAAIDYLTLGIQRLKEAKINL